MNRRIFIRNSALASASVLSPWPLQALARDEIVKLTILHTNDVHSHVDPFPKDHKRYPGMGGAATRSAIISQIRQTEEHVLLLDAGDILQGTPYFNFFDGDLEFDLMNDMKYDAATIGNHDFDGGIDLLAKQTDRAGFPMVNCNYDFRDTIMDGKAVPYKIFKRGRLKIGVTGVGVELDGLVPSKLFGKTIYEDPVNNVNRIAHHLKMEERCDYVILLSHLGYEYKSDKISDVQLASRSTNIDLIIGGHTHTFLDKPVVAQNSQQKDVLITQVGWAGVLLGKIDVLFHKKRNKKYVSGQTVIVDKKSIVI